jgi:hypothetical protein
MSKKYLSALVCGFGAAVLTTIPVIQTIACCLLAPVASAASIFLYKKSQPDLLKIKTGTGIFLGILTAIFAALFASGFEIIITYFAKTSDLVASMPQAEKVIKDMKLGPAAEESLIVISQMISDIQSKGFSFLYTLLITATNLITYSIFGMLGGVIGTAIINKRTNQLS